MINWETSKMEKVFQQIAQFLQVPSGNISIDTKTELPICLVNKERVCGTFNILKFYREHSKRNFQIKSNIELAEHLQWIEYTLVYVMPHLNTSTINNALKELNKLFATKTYFMDQITIADLFLYYIIYEVIASLSATSKGDFINVCRWFDNIQQNPDIRQSNKLIDFSVNRLLKIM